MKVKYIGARPREIAGPRRLVVQPGEVFEVGDKLGRSLLRQTRRFQPAEPDHHQVLNGNLEELKAFAAQFDIDLGGAKKKSEILDVIRNVDLTDEQIAWIRNVEGGA